MNYKTMKLTSAKRITIPVNAVVEIEVNECVEIPQMRSVKTHKRINHYFGQFFLRKMFTKQGLLQAVHTPFPSGYNDKPLVVVKNDSVAPIEILANEELGEIWIWGNF